MKRRIEIVIEETGEENGKGFNVYLSGDKERIGKVKEDDMSPAEFWGSKLFLICTNALKQSGAVAKVHKRQ